MFSQMWADNQDEALEQLFSYVSNTWLHNSLFPVDTWTSFKMSVRTNNHVEGWHNNITTRAQHYNLNLYKLLELLHSDCVELINLIQLGQHEERVRGAAKVRNEKLWGLWERFDAGDMPVKMLLDECTKLV